MLKQKLKELPEDLILKILSKLPLFNESVATRLISKRHEEPWKLVPEVTFEDDNEESCVTFWSFVYGSLLSDASQTLERLHLMLTKKCYSASDINFWVQLAVNRSVRKLRFNLYGETLILPSCLSSCTTLKSLILRNVSIELVPRGFSLPSLKSLHLLRGCPDLEYLVLHKTCYGRWNLDEVDTMHNLVVLSSLKSLHLLSSQFYSLYSFSSLLESCPVLKYLVLHKNHLGVIPPKYCLSSIRSLHLSSFNFFGKENIATLLKRCAALEDLIITNTKDDRVMLYNINVPTLKSLTINNSIEKLATDDKENHGFWINAPALETLNIKDSVSNFLMLEFMPGVTKAKIQVICDQSEKFIGSLTFIEQLSLCSPTSEIPHRRGSIFAYLEHLELCTCSPGWANLLVSILGDAPRLQTLKLKSNHSAPSKDQMNFWNEPAVVPECLLTHLEIFEWRQYEDTVQQRKVAAYILANALWLKMATFSTRCRDKDHGVLMQIKKLNRESETCQLVFE